MSDSENNTQQQDQNQCQDGTENIDKLIQDPAKRAELIPKLGLTNPVTSLLLTPCGTPAGDVTAGLTPSGMSAGDGAMPPMWSFGPFFLPQLATWPYAGWLPQKPTLDAGTTSGGSQGL